MAWMAMGESAKIHGPLICNFHKWMFKIKKALDPNIVCDPGGYISEGPPPGPPPGSPK
jgi:hypothetical protein